MPGLKRTYSGYGAVSRTVRPRMGKRGYRRRRRWTVRKRARKSSFAKAVKAVIMRTSEPKQMTVPVLNTSTDAAIDGTWRGHPMLHNQIKAFRVWEQDITSYRGVLEIPTGDLENQRTGSEIYLKGIRIHGFITFPQTLRNVMVKMWFVEYNNNAGDPTTSAGFFKGNSVDRICDVPNLAKYKPKYLGTITYRPKDIQQGGDENTCSETIPIKRYLKIKRKLSYGASGTSVNVVTKGVLTNGYVLAMAYRSPMDQNLQAVPTLCYISIGATAFFADP